MLTEVHTSALDVQRLARLASGVVQKSLAEVSGLPAAAARALLEDPTAADVLGAAARERVRERFLGTHSLVEYLDVIEPLLRGKEAA